MPDATTPAHADSLGDALDAIENEVNELTAHVRRVLENTPVTDHYLMETLNWWGRRGRYLLLRPDGKPYYGIPLVRYVQTEFTQRPAALRAAHGLAGCRVYDIKAKRVIA